jgi:4-alpha-glucanotransferase
MKWDRFLDQRSSGVLLHFSSLPGPHGSGDLGPAAWRFADWLASAGQRLWQVLPLNPPGPGNSPYQSVSAFAGSPALVALEPLVERGWLSPATADFDPARIDFDAVTPWRLARLREAAAGFTAHATTAEREAHATWQAVQADWLDDYALYAALKAAHGEQPWWAWPAALRRREPAALAAARRALAEDIAFHRFVQWCFDTQLAALKAHANARGVRLMGDVPIFIAHDSADCWARPDLFRLDADDQPTVVAGVPPDGYSPDGQRWGNPLYDWERMAAEGYAWWTARVRRLLVQADVFRIDHFRGFAGFWEIPADRPTARDGRWVPGPGAPLFEALEAAFPAQGGLPIVAEDLGLITPDVVALRERFGFPGMRIVYEGFLHGAAHPFLPHHHERSGLVYSSTHDSDTVRGWWDGATREQRAFAAAYLGVDAAHGDDDIAWAVVRATLTSVARLAVIPMQDLLGLPSAQRMNVPGTLGGENWRWRLQWAQIDDALAPRLRALAEASGRCG